MNKKMLAFLAVVVMVATMFSACMNRGGDVSNVERIAGESTLYTHDDIDTAMDIAINHFKKEYEGCTLLKISYDEVESIKEMERQREKYGDVKFLILVSEFYVGEDAEGCFNPNSTYTGWKWILQYGNDGWVLVSWGYA